MKGLRLELDLCYLTSTKFCLKLFAVLILILSLVSLTLAIKPAQDGGRTHAEPISKTNKQPSDVSGIRPGGLQQQAAEQTDLTQSPSSPRAHVTMEAPSTSPSITSVHQVWTSASSGSLDELSPEVIGKLRSDVPFLAAYALRPRLVGGLMSQAAGSSKLVAQGEQRIYHNPNGGAQSKGDDGTLMLDIGASSPRGATESLVPKLGDFSEFRVETSSTSKSEHHHKRKTSLKRKGDEELHMKKRVLAEASQLVKRRRRRNNNNKLANRNNSNKASRAKKTSKLHTRGRKSSSGRSGSKSNRKIKALLRRASQMRTKLNRRNLQHHMNIIRHGRLIQGQTVGSNGEDMDSDDNAADERGSTKVGGGGDVKGGPRSAGRKPFYSEALPSAAGSGERPPPPLSADDGNDTENDDKEQQQDDTPQVSRKKAVADSDETDGQGKTINEVDEDVELDRLPEPKRVGDADVDEEGDTVTVMPKFDGVDDDPELPPDYDGAQGPESETPEGGDVVGESERDNDEPRTRRINRERPNESRVGAGPSASGASEEDRGDGSISSSSGGGLGATAGGGDRSLEEGGPDGSVQNEPSSDSGKDDGGEPEGKLKPGVEFADEHLDDDDVRKNSGASGGADRDSTSDNDDDRNIKSPGDSEEDFNRDERRQEEFESKKEKGFGGHKNEDDADVGKSSQDGGRKIDSADRKVLPKPHIEPDSMPDVDYRDDGTDSDKKGSKMDDNSDDIPKKIEDGKGADPEQKKDCDDGSYNHHDDHHHDHHDSIKWLQDAIPGEPNRDYPILSRANVSNFSCSDQKYPGYYADVEARCQVFHICQADGRHDSFLCPNGTIFSQKTYVCVWWNSYDCEDAPKYYDLNALLYKSSSSNNKNRGNTDLRPLDGERISSSWGDRAKADDEDSSIDNLIKSMRRNKAQGGENSFQPDGGRSMNRGIGPGDEATIQRKSTNVDEDERSLIGSSRLRKSNAEPRRKRRASVRQAPPKLSARRYPRIPKRTKKIRYSVKPRRRA